MRHRDQTQAPLTERDCSTACATASALNQSKVRKSELSFVIPNDKSPKCQLEMPNGFQLNSMGLQPK